MSGVEKLRILSVPYLLWSLLFDLWALSPKPLLDSQEAMKDKHDRKIEGQEKKCTGFNVEISTVQNPFCISYLDFNMSVEINILANF